MFKQAFNSWQSHASGTSPSLCLATDQIMLKSSRENWIRGPCCCVVIFFSTLISSLLKAMLRSFAALPPCTMRPLSLHSSCPATPHSTDAASSSSTFFSLSLQRTVFSLALQIQSCPLPWSPRSLIREAKSNISTTKLAFFSLPPPLSCCLVWGCWLLPGWSRAFPGKAVTLWCCPVGLLAVRTDEWDKNQSGIIYITSF